MVRTLFSCFKYNNKHNNKQTNNCNNKPIMIRTLLSSYKHNNKQTNNKNKQTADGQDIILMLYGQIDPSSPLSVI